MTHKETSYQPAHSGIPGLWVVQYYNDDSLFPQARYFLTEEKAKAFEREVLDDSNQLCLPL